VSKQWVRAAKRAGLKTSPIWFLPPARWTGCPAGTGHDEFARKTVWFGSWLTGVVVIAYRNCGEPECVTERGRMIREFQEDIDD
jgi:hypothetical protein